MRYSYYTDKGEKKWDMTSVRDLSDTGMSVITNHHFSPNEIVTFLVKIPNMPLEWTEIAGRIIASGIVNSLSTETASVYLTRVEFINLKEEHKELIRRYVAWFLSQKGGGPK